ncbi:sperm flagellar protein 1 [Nasonia vitripennis]|uniref:Calponin-homology (CH) domain-containing protein n=1 Tax=Nasonia vitripennis TaxID=7425 RepID=A0A7M7PZK7_NASVI|nr:sperm flagellar protein 1 [Nasonia vitripennis]
MSAGAEIGDNNVGEIYAWLDQIPLSRPKRNVARDFSDGVLMAELLKRYYPRHVDVQNYIPGSSIAKKIDNWCTLNRKVFPKLNLKLSKETINKVAQSQPGAIEKVLSEVRSKIIRDCNADRNSMFKDCEDAGGDELLKHATNPEDSLNQTVPKKTFLKVKKELEEKTQAIHILLKKVEHLESMLRFKEQRIEDLASQIQLCAQKT